MPRDCLFCRIVSGEAPSSQVCSTARSYAFRDLDPQAPTHVLVVPRAHIESADVVSPADADDVTDLLTTAQAVARQEGLVGGDLDAADAGYRLIFNVGHISGNTVGHLHLHLLGGRGMGWPPG